VECDDNIYSFRQLVYSLILPIRATVEGVIRNIYEYANFIGLKVEYGMDLIINKSLYIRPLTTDDVKGLLADRRLRLSNLFDPHFTKNGA
jgi:hypothetical protein